MTIRSNGRMMVVNDTVNKVEDVARYDRSHSHETPILRHTEDTKSLCYKSWVDAKEEAISN